MSTIYRPPSSPEPLPDPFPGEYRIVRRVGSGAYGAVWEAHDIQMGIAVALKTLRVPWTDDRAEEALERLRGEARLVAQVRHPNVVLARAWRDTTTHDFRHCLVMDFVRGGSLSDLMQTSGPLAWERAVRYVADVGEALRAVHAHGIVHRDVKPANILWDDAKDEALLTDFGVSARLADGPDVVAGTVPYMAPEAFEGVAEPPVDVYALAATLYQLVCGRVPFVVEMGGHAEAVRRGLPAPDPGLAVVPEPVEQLIRDGLRFDRATRPTLSAFVSALRGALNRSLADAVVNPNLPPGAGRPPGTGTVRLSLDRLNGTVYEPIATTHRNLAPQRATRDMKKVPAAPAAAGVRTGDHVRIRAVLDRAGYLTVFNIGPTGSLNLLYPDDPAAPRPLPANQPVDVCEVEFKPPVGKERVFAFWSQSPLPLTPKELHSLVDAPAVPETRAYRVTRDMKKVKASLQTLPPGAWHAVSLELDHQGR